MSVNLRHVETVEEIAKNLTAMENEFKKIMENGTEQESVSAEMHSHRRERRYL